MYYLVIETMKRAKKKSSNFLLVAGEIGSIFKKDRLSQPLWAVAGRNWSFIRYGRYAAFV
jgi:hypothetical protein